ncbi:MAG: hypothetical protein H6725_09745 [Sandaracinaceae bacterium]|nr:hypothetical protein [Sandaracinaceae bacterium]
MDSPSALVPGPIARTLLELAERRASGEIAIGGRKLVLHEGQVIGVLPAPGDEPLDTFLVKAGRLDDAGARHARSKSEMAGTPLLHELESVLTPAQLTQGLRALWLDRLVFGLQVDVDAGQGLNDFEPAAALSARAGEHRTPLLELLLDALARRAGERDAGLVGSQANKLLIWHDSAHREAAEAWAELPALDPPRVARLLATSPAAASRIAALLRAGLVYLSARVDSPPPPPPRPNTIAPPPAATNAALPGGSLVAPPTGVRARPAVATRPSEFAQKLPSLPPVLMRLDDPLDPLEKRIANLETSSAPARERATAWLEFGRAWQRHHRSLEEACRAFRESAAADPTFYDALDAAASLCTAMGRVELGNAYARAAAAAAGTPTERARSLKQIARNQMRFSAIDEAEASLVEALAADPSDGDALEALARVRYQRGDTDAAAATAEAAAAAVRRPERARALLGLARGLADSPARTSAYARALNEGGFAEAALSELRIAAAAASAPDTRRGFLLEAAELAELAARPDLACDFLLDAFVAEPALEVLHDPLVADARAALTEAPLAIVLEAVATATEGSARARWLRQAHEAYARANANAVGDGWAAELLVRALCADPAAAELVTALEAEAQRLAHPSLLLDGLERAGRHGGIPEDDQEDAASRAARAALLDRAAQLAEDEGQPARALYCLRSSLELRGLAEESEADPRVLRLRELSASRAELVQVARGDLDAASPEERDARALRLGLLLRDVPEQRSEAIDCLRAALAGAAEHHAAAFGALVRAYRVEGREAECVDLLLSAPRYLDREEAADALGEAAGTLALMRDPLGCAGAAMEALALQPSCPFASTRLDIAARQVGDPDLRLRALRARLQQSPEAREAARLEGLIALVADAAGAPDVAIAAAREALRLDARCADALSLLVRYFDALPDSEALAWVAPAREVLGDTPALLDKCLTLADRAGDEELGRALLDAHFRILPRPAVALERVRRAMRAAEQDPERDADALLERADQALLPLCVAPETAAVVSDALTVLRKLSRENAACTLALRALDTLGERELLKQSWELAKSGVDQASKIATLERIVAWTEASARVDPLRRLAAIQRELGNAAAEARTLLRVLAEEPHDPPSLERLAELYTETGETQRLMAVLALSLEAATGVGPRRVRLLCLAQAAMQRANDPERALGFIEQAVEESSLTGPRAEQARSEWLELVSAVHPDSVPPAAAAGDVAEPQPPRRPTLPGVGSEGFDVDAWESVQLRELGDDVEELTNRYAAEVRALEGEGELLTALELATRGLKIDPPHPELLVTFERLTLASDAVDRAKAMYEDLCARAMGPHGLRGLRYREARWLESAGANHEALTAYAQAFAMAPGEGVVFNAIERLSVLVSDSRAMVDALAALAERATLADRRVELTRRAGGLAEKVLKQPERAFELYEKTFKQTNRSELLPTLRRLGNAVEETLPERVAAMRELVIEGLRNRIEMSWDAPDQIESLCIIAAIEGADRHNLDAEVAVAEEALAIVERERDGKVQAATLLRALAARLGSAGRVAEAASYTVRADELDPAGVAATRTSDAAPSASVGSQGPAAASEDWGRPSAAPDAPTAWTETPEREGTVTGVVGETAPVAECGESPGSSAATSPDNELAAPTLASLEALPADDPRAAMCHGIARWFRDGTVEHAIGPAPDHGVIDAVRRGPRELDFGVLSAVWHCALPVFRKTLRQHGAADGRRVSGIGNRPLALAVREALARTRSHDVAVYACDPTAGTVRVAPTHPPSVLVCTLDDSPARLVFRLARAMHLARPESILLSSRTPEEGRTLMAAIQGAFGPHDPGRSIDPDTASLAADLWHTIASRDQADIRHALQEQMLDFDELLALTQARAALVGLISCGQPTAAVAGLFADDPALVGITELPPEERFRQALANSDGFTALVDYALQLR